ncbi:MAG: response regulator [Asticcacaulis sp.]
MRDTGIGISPEGQRNLFQRFSQIDPDKGGTGLGLLICKQLVELMGGDIGVRSKPGQGSEFWFDIPAPVEDLRHMGGLPEIRAPGRILVVDDQDSVRELLVNLLGAAGHDVATAHDGAAALKACAAQGYDLIFMDLNMPVMDGFAAARSLRGSAGPNAETPILGLTASGHEDRRDACRAAGMNDMLTKPLSPSSLALAVARWMHESPGGKLRRAG